MPPYRKVARIGRRGKKENGHLQRPSKPGAGHSRHHFPPTHTVLVGTSGVSRSLSLPQSLSFCPRGAPRAAREAPGSSRGLSCRSNALIFSKVMVRRICTLAAVRLQLHTLCGRGSSVCPCRTGHVTTRGLSTRVTEGGGSRSSCFEQNSFVPAV